MNQPRIPYRTGKNTKYCAVIVVQGSFENAATDSMSEAVLEQQPENLSIDPSVDQEEKTDSPLKRFLGINEARIARLQSSVGQRKQAFLDALPMLFHTNDSALPGYVSDNTPFGIIDYSPSGQTLYEARRIAKNTKIGKKAPRKFDLSGIYFMGSAGTIAYNGKSDFDIWLFVDPEIEDDRLGELRKKADLIEEWAAKSEVEVHFFIINPDRFRAGEMLPLSSESSGSSQHGLLLDEFYRSSILIAGLPLTWWMVAPEYEVQFDAYIESQRHVENSDHPLDESINLGPLTEIAPEEFFGAAVWQLNKSIKFPYKSVLKLLLMEVYANDESGISLISHQFKKRVYDGTVDINLLDPWMLMFEQVEEYLQDKDDNLRLKILRRSFYLKINEKVSQQLNNSRFGNWKQKLTHGLMKNWDWDEDQILELDSRESWKLETVSRERGDLINTLTKSFRALTRFAQHHTENPLITQADLQLLNRRLYSAFERKSGKIEIINRGISPDISEGTVSLHLMKSTAESTWGLPVSTTQTPSSWVLYRGIVTLQDLGDSTHLKRTSSLIEMLAWCYFNEVLNKDSKISLYLPADKNISQQEIKTILEAFSRQFPIHQQVNEQTLSEPVRITSGAVFVNTGLEPKADPSLNDTLLSSQRNNALSYGGQHENLTKTFDLIFTTSWGETFIKHYSGTDGLIDCLTEYMSWAPPSQKRAPAILDVYCYSPGYGAQIRKTLNTLFRDFVEHFYAEDGSEEGRYILEIEDGFQSIEIYNDVISHKVLEDKTALTDYLAKPASRFTPLYFGPYASADTALPAIFAVNKPETVQLFFHLKKGKAKVYILDEKGSLFIQKDSFNNKHSLFGHYKIFADTIIERITHNDLSNLLHETECTTEMYLIEKKLQRDGRNSYEIEQLSLMSDRSENFLSLQVLCDRDENNSEQYTIYCEDQEFSSLQFGDELFDAVAKQVMRHRGSKQAYPVYITDIDLSPSMLNDSGRNQFQSNQFFRYKKHIESKLTNSLGKL